MADALTISVAAACSRYGVSRPDLFSLLQEGHVPTIRLQRRTLILRALADDFFFNVRAEKTPEDTQFALEL